MRMRVFEDIPGIVDRAARHASIVERVDSFLSSLRREPRFDDRLQKVDVLAPLGT